MRDDGRGGHDPKSRRQGLPLTQPRVLITGASGFTGHYLVEKAVERGYLVYSFSQGQAGKTAEVRDVAGDLRDPASLRAALGEVQPDYIIHLAAIANVAHGAIGDYYQVNQLGTINLLEAIRAEAPGIRKVVLASSANVYGVPDELPITESTPEKPVNHYGFSKHFMEKSASLYEDLPILVTRPFNYTGRGQSEDFLIPKLVNAFRERKDRVELGNIEVARDFSDVRDVASVYLALLDADASNRVFNICSGVATKLSEVLDMLSQLSGHRCEISSTASLQRSREIPVSYGSPAQLESVIGDYRHYDLRQTLAWMLEP